MNNLEINVFDKIPINERINHYLIIDAVYKSNPKEKTMSADFYNYYLPGPSRVLRSHAYFYKEPRCHPASAYL